MLRKNLHILLCLTTILILSCSNKHDSEKFEQQIFDDTFTEVFKHTFEDYRKRRVPPPPPANDSKGELDKMHKAFEKAEYNHKVFIDTTNFAPLYVIANDTALGLSKKALRQIYEEPYHGARFIDTLENKPSFKLDIEKFDLGQEYILKYKSEFKETIQELKMRDWKKYPREEKHLWQFSGMLSFSRIYFNKEQSYGFLNVSFSCGGLCGCGYRVFVKKVNNEWVIDKIDDLGCA